MACSDNVVRGGLTPKLKDANVLINMLTYEYGQEQVDTGIEEVSEGIKLYRSGFKEFDVLQIEAGSESRTYDCKVPSIMICVDGSGKVETKPFGVSEGQEIKKYESYYMTPEHIYEITGSENTTVYIAQAAQ